MYEVHITAFEHPKKEDIERLKHFNKENMTEAKTLLIGLNYGQFPLQLISTIKALEEQDEQWMLLAGELLADTYKNSFPVVRLKVESSNLEGKAVYFEAHWKIVRPLQSTYRKLLNDFYKDEGLYFSRNMLVEKVYWLTSRAYNCSATRALDIFEEHSKVLDEDKVSAVHHYERVIIDTNKNLDSGWAEPDGYI